MAPKKRVKCLCGCNRMVTTATEKRDLSIKYVQGSVSLSISQKKRAHSAVARARRQPLATPQRHVSPPIPARYEAEAPVPLNIGEPLPMDLDDLAPPPIDNANIWTQVFQNRHSNTHEESSGDANSHTSSISGFLSQPDSDDDAQPDYEALTEQTSNSNANLQRIHSEPGIRVATVRNAPKSLTRSQLDDIRVFRFIHYQKLSVSTYHAMQDEFCLKSSHSDLPSLKQLRTRVFELSGFQPKVYDCCQHNCMCFSRPFADLTRCLECGTPRSTPGTAKVTFEYLSPIPQLQALYSNPETQKLMEYRCNYKTQNDPIEDIFDGDEYHRLRQTHVSIDGQQQPYKFFEDEREVALMFSTDGMCPFKRRKHSCWPLILINCNLPPDIRTHIDNIICVGLIPGPKHPTNLASYLIPLIDDLLELAKGVQTVDFTKGVLFSLRAHLLAGFGDIPALSKMLEFLGHNACYPCRMCSISTIQGITAKGGTHRYCPLHRSDTPPIDPLRLPLRTHEECIRLGLEVLNAPSENASTNLATQSGIKGVSVFARLPSVSIPRSFPIDIMHMVWINLIPQLTMLWTCKFNDMSEGRERYSIHPSVWEALAQVTEESGSTMPGVFGCRVPNLTSKSHFTAESWSIFATFLAPSLLRRRFRRPVYYVHFVRLIKLMNRCTSFSIRRAEIDEIRQGLARWVQDYERIYYQYDIRRMQYLGPAWIYWSFSMERFNSYIGAAVKSRRFPYVNIARRIRDAVQLRIIRERYHLHGRLGFKPSAASNDPDHEDKRNAERFPDYPRTLLLTPHSTFLSVTTQLKNKIAKYLATTFNIKANSAIQKLIPPKLKQWGRIAISQGGDTIHANGYHRRRSDERDASFVRYELLVDKNASRRNAPVVLHCVSHYGRLEHVFALPLQPNSILNKSSTPKTLLLALISEAKVIVENTYEYRVVWYEDNLGSGEVVDVQTIQCVVGRILDGKRTWIVDRNADCELTFPTFD